MSDTDDDFEDDLAATFETDHGIDTDLAADAAAKAATFRADYEPELTVEGFVEAMAATPYDSFEHAFDGAIGTFADANEDCTDSREYRLAGFGSLAADPEQESAQL